MMVPWRLDGVRRWSWGSSRPWMASKDCFAGLAMCHGSPGPDTLTLEPSRSVVLPGRVSNALIRRYEPYFTALQTRIAKALCGLDTGAPNEIIVSFVVSESGVIVGAEPLIPSGNPARDVAIAANLRGLHIDEAPPSDLPQARYDGDLSVFGRGKHWMRRSDLPSDTRVSMVDASRDFLRRHYLPCLRRAKDKIDATPGLGGNWRAMHFRKLGYGWRRRPRPRRSIDPILISCASP